VSAFPFPPPVATMEARVREGLPTGGWAYEPKWDGFRSVAWGRADRLDSRNQRPLRRYFPELADAVAALPAGAVVDGEVVVVVGGRTDFDALQNRIHPAASRITLLSVETPAELVAFDLLAADGEDLRPRPFRERRERLMGVMAETAHPAWHLTPSTTDAEVARRWFTEFESAGCDGIVCKVLDGPYVEGQRAMVKVKHRRTADCVVGGYRLHKEGDRIGSVLLGLYNDAGQLHFIGHCSGFGDADRVRILERLRALEAGDAFGQDARRPGGPSRWTGGKDLTWVPLEPQLVVEVSYDQLTGERFRHATRFERWRADKDPRDCTMEQLERPEGPAFGDIVVATGGA
jgi:ATP-dependent DNA ligase